MGAPNFGLCNERSPPSFHASCVKDPDENQPFLAATALFSPLAILPSFGFAVTGQSWTRNRTVVMHLSLPPGTGTFQDGFNSFGESAEDALNIWNQHLAHMQFAVDRNSILPPESLDGDTSVSMSNTVYGDAFRRQHAGGNPGRRPRLDHVRDGRHF